MNSKSLSRKLALLAAGVSLSALACAATYHLDAVNGSDTTGDGSASAPFQSFAHALASVDSGDTVLMYSGNYGDIVAGRTSAPPWQADPVELFDDWVTFKAAPGETPVATSLSIGTLNIPGTGSPREKIPFSQKGNADLWIAFEGITVEDGVDISGSRHVIIRDCAISSYGPLNGSTAIDGIYGVTFQNGRYITVEGNDITHTAIGVGGYTYDLVVRNNEIHHNSHDGLRVLGGENWLIEGNTIHNLDDGTGDDDGESWNRHADGIHIFTAKSVTHNLTIRGNTFYHLESMGIMAQGGTSENPHTNWVIENNIFGPVGGLTAHFGMALKQGFTVRHNTVVYAPNDVWTSIFGRVMHPDIYRWSMWNTSEEEAPGFRFYNNLYYSDGGTDFLANYNYGFIANNGFYDASTGFPYEVPPGNIDDFIAAGGVLGAPLPGSDVIDAGSAAYTGELPLDRYYTPRDAAPDIGAVEFIADLTYPQWVLDHSLAGVDALPESDPDGDGVANFFEYAFATNPLDSSSGELPNVLSAHDSATVWLVHRRSIRADLEWSYESSLDLEQWTPATPLSVEIETIPGDTSGAVQSRVEFTMPSPEAVIFLRLTPQEP